MMTSIVIGVLNGALWVAAGWRLFRRRTVDAPWWSSLRRDRVAIAVGLVTALAAIGGAVAERSAMALPAAVTVAALVTAIVARTRARRAG